MSKNQEVLDTRPKNNLVLDSKPKMINAMQPVDNYQIYTYVQTVGMYMGIPGMTYTVAGTVQSSYAP